MTHILAHMTDSAAFVMLALMLGVPVITYILAYRLIFKRFLKGVKEKNPDTFWIIHIMMFIVWLVVLILGFRAISLVVN